MTTVIAPVKVGPDLVPRRAALAIIGASCTTVMTAGVSGCGLRQDAPRFEYTLLNGQRASSDALRGQVVMIAFWATSCGPCVQKMPELVETHRRYATRGLQTLAVAMDYDPPAAVAQFAESRALPFGVVIDNTGAIAKAFGRVRVTPTTVLVDKRGGVAMHTRGVPEPPELRHWLEKLLAEPA
jgi:peroxiredoxin